MGPTWPSSRSVPLKNRPQISCPYLLRLDCLEKKKIETSIKELQAHIYAGFKKAKFCKEGKPNKTAGQIVRYIKNEVEDHWYERQRYAKILFGPGEIKEKKDQLDFNKERNMATEIKKK